MKSHVFIESFKKWLDDATVIRAREFDTNGFVVKTLFTVDVLTIWNYILIFTHTLTFSENITRSEMLKNKRFQNFSAYNRTS